MEKIRGILFDFDGVLADSMNDNYEAWRKSFSEFGAIISKKEYFMLEGRKLIEIAGIIGSRYKIKQENYQRLVELKNKFYLELHSFKFFPGVVELIENLHGKVKMCIVSASPRHKIEKTVPKEFLERFDAVVSEDDTKKGKPDPEPYLTGCEKIKLLPQECIVIENAPLGIKSAKLAGIFCIAISSTLERDILKEADMIAEKFGDLKNIKAIASIIDNPDLFAREYIKL